MGQLRRNFGSNRQNMNLLHFCLILLLVLTVNGAPKPDPKPAPKPKAKGQMAIIFNNRRGHIDYSVHDYNGYGGPGARGGPSRRNGPKPEQNFGNSIGSQTQHHGNNQWNNQIPYHY